MQSSAVAVRYRWLRVDLAPLRSKSHLGAVSFDIVGPIRNTETIAVGRSIREIRRLERQYGLRGKWRKRKGSAFVRLESGRTRRAELHWYEGHGIGRVRMKIKRFLD
jgi:hypothetical protein